MPTVAFATTAPEGSVTCPRKLPAADEDELAVDVWACECANLDATETVSAKIRIEVVIELMLELAKVDRRCNLYLLLSRHFKL
jgi:hypothetical protein